MFTITPAEIDAVKTAVITREVGAPPTQERLDSFVVVNLSTNGNFTTAIVSHANRLFIGAAKRNPKDAPNQAIGDRIAISRAMRQAFQFRR